MKKILISLLSVLALGTPLTLQAQDFFDTSDAAKFFSFSARVGLNTSNRTFPSGYHNEWNKDSWGMGFNVGVIANLNFKEYLSLQPGIFYESRSGNFAYATDYLNYSGGEETYYQMGHLRAYYLTIPVVAAVKFNLAENIKWQVEFGPYLQFKMREKGQENVAVLYRLPQSNWYAQYTAQPKGFDVGLKMGTGLQVYKHYYVGVHYMAGLCHAWKLPTGGKNKSWQFSIGYDF